MKKYRFAKDVFPFGREGEFIEVDVDSNFSDLMTLYNDKDGEHFLDCQDYIILDQIIKEGWIEEVKPREFWVEIRKSDNVATDIYESYKPDSLNMIERYNYIKVREVLE